MVNYEVDVLYDNGVFGRYNVGGLNEEELKNLEDNVHEKLGQGFLTLQRVNMATIIVDMSKVSCVAIRGEEKING